MGTVGKKAVFLDRDGTIIVEKEFLSDPNGIELIPGADNAIKKLNNADFAVVILSNQSGVARGYFGEDTVKSINNRIIEIFANEGARIDAIYYCPHYPDGIVPEYSIRCGCRKPEMGLVKRAIEELGIEPAFMVGDRKDDVLLGNNLGVPAILVLTGYGTNCVDEVSDIATHIAHDINDAVNWILNFRL